MLDKNGNRVKISKTQPQAPVEQNNSASYIYDQEKSRLVQIDDGVVVNLTYDDEGQLQSNGTNTYSFNDRYQTTQINNQSFDYDGLGNRLKVSKSGTITYYIYDEGQNLIAEADASKQIIRYYIQGVGLSHMIEGSQSYVYHFDAIGSTMAMTDHNGAIVNQYAYSPFGKLLGKTENNPQPFTFVGQYGIQTGSANVYYMRARYYDADTGRFISEDPIGLDGGINLYSYVGGNPLLYNDPTGNCPSCIGAVANLAIDAGVSYYTTGTYTWTQAGIALVAGATGGAAAQRIAQISRLAGTTRQIAANAVAGGIINVAAGAANGSDDHGLNFALGVGGSVLGSTAGALTTNSNSALFGARGIATGGGKIIAATAESFLAGSGALGGSGANPALTATGSGGGGK